MEEYIVERRGENEVAIVSVKTGGLTIDQLNVPAFIDANRVVEICASALRECVGLRFVNIPQSVRFIHEQTFDPCFDLQAINVAADNAEYASVNGVLFNKEKTTLVRYPQGKDFVKYEVPDGVKRIGASAFFGCYQLEEIALPSSVETIGKNAFMSCQFLKSVRIPESVVGIADDAFENCDAIARVCDASYAKSWALEHNRAYELTSDATWNCMFEESARVKLLFESVQAALKDAELHFDSDEKKYSFTFKLSCSNSGLRWTNCHVQVRKNDVILRMSSPIRCDVSNTRTLSTVVLLVNRINYKLAQGDFELDFATGELSFKIDVDCAALNSVPQTLVMAPLVVAKEAWKHYQACFLNAIFGFSADVEECYALNCVEDDDDDDDDDDD